MRHTHYWHWKVLEVCKIRPLLSPKSILGAYSNLPTYIVLTSEARFWSISAFNRKLSACQNLGNYFSSLIFTDVLGCDKLKGVTLNSECIAGRIKERNISFAPFSSFLQQWIILLKQNLNSLTLKAHFFLYEKISKKVT